jgi:hypothetical protein
MTEDRLKGVPAGDREDHADYLRRNEVASKKAKEAIRARGTVKKPLGSLKVAPLSPTSIK